MSDWAGDTEEPLGYQVKGPPFVVLNTVSQPSSLQFVYLKNKNNQKLKNKNRKNNKKKYKKNSKKRKLKKK